MLFDKIKQIETLLPQSLRFDRVKIKKEIFRIKRLSQKPEQSDKLQKRLSKIESHLIESVNNRKRRKNNVPKVSIDPNLPIHSKQNEIIEIIKTHQILIVSGDTGSGKTTQIPKLCLLAGRGIDGKIGVTQPRRIAAITVASRISEELNQDLGQSVGYKIRFQEKVGKSNYIKIMTDGILLAETQTDPFLNQYDTLIIDEAHERSLNIDFVLGLLKTLVSKRNDLKLIITSATIDTEKFSKAFDNAPIIEISGRMYPVEVKYWPPELFHNDEDITHVDMAVETLNRLQKMSPWGDILVFMPTEQDIRETCDLLEGKKFKRVSVLPLFAKLSSDAQKRVFTSIPGRKIIVATNVAETSITIPGIKYVVDTGLARMLKYLPKTRTTALPVEPISRSSADQRMGRCGRIENGVCIRLYSKEDYQSRPLYTPPEILRSNLAEVILRMIALKLGNIEEFPFIDQPTSKSISDGFELLKELGAIEEIKGKKYSGKYRYGLTEMGRFMAKIPLDPRISRMLIEAKKQQCIPDIMVIASALSIQDPRERPLEKAEEADRAQNLFVHPASDFVTLLNLYKDYRKVWFQYKSAGKLKRFCKDHYLSFKRMREWRHIVEQLKTILEESGIGSEALQGDGSDRFDKNISDTEYETIHKSILSGFLSNIAQKKEKNLYKAAKNQEVMIFPGSGLFNHGKDWIVAAEMMETSRLFARTCANISSHWLEDLGKNLCRYSYVSPCWDKKRGEVIVYEQVSLFGLVIVEQRLVSYGKINPTEATEIFIRSALMENNIPLHFDFIKHNRELINKIIDLENRLRRRDILVGDEQIFKFYRSRLGKHVSSIKTLKSVIKKAGGDNFLCMCMEDIINYLPDPETISLFPDRMQLGENHFLCKYHFEPGNHTDGLTVNIPASLISSVNSDVLDWHAPGFMEEKIFFLLKGLPKKYRKKLVPITDTVKLILEELPKENVSLLTALSRIVFNRFGVDIPASAWAHEKLSDHLKIRFSIVDKNGKTIYSGRDKAILNRDFSKKIDPEKIAQVKKAWERDNIRQWDFGDLPDTITVKTHGEESWILYPGLNSNEHNTVSLRIFTDRQEAVKSHKKGIMTLFEHHFAKELKFLKKDLGLFHISSEYSSLLGGRKEFENRVFDSVQKELFEVNIRTIDRFSSHAKMIRGKILTMGQQKGLLASEILKAVFETRQTIYQMEDSNRHNPDFLNFCNHMRNALEKIVPDNFLDLYSNDHLSNIPRYIQAIGIRAKKRLINPEKDIAKANTLKGFLDKLEEILKTLTPDTSEEKKLAVEELFWFTEEFKVSLFAQELKTNVAVSEKRLLNKIHEIKRMV